MRTKIKNTKVHGLKRLPKESEEDHLRILKRIAIRTIRKETDHTYFIGGILLAELDRTTYTYSFYDYKSVEERLILAHIYLHIKDPEAPYYLSSIKIVTGEVDEKEIRSTRR